MAHKLMLDDRVASQTLADTSFYRQVPEFFFMKQIGLFHPHPLVDLVRRPSAAGLLPLVTRPAALGVFFAHLLALYREDPLLLAPLEVYLHAHNKTEFDGVVFHYREAGADCTAEFPALVA